jgi:Activator of Hsp90 ATPase homolog 1-like protein
MVTRSSPDASPHPWRVRCSGTVRLPPGVPAPLSLFTPEGERAWAAGWDPSYPAQAEDDSQPGTVFQTRHGPHTGTWIVASREPGRSIRYTRVIADQDAGTVTVTLDGSDSASGTQLTVCYDLTALSEPGAAHLARFAAGYPQFLAHWAEAISAALAS